MTKDANPLVNRFYTDGKTHPYDKVAWEQRDALLGDPADPVFFQGNVEVPTSWSQNATNIVAQKYFAYSADSPQRENSVKTLIDRVVDKIASEGRRHGYFKNKEEQNIFSDELKDILVNQRASFNSPVWFNIGVDGVAQQCSACFILSVEDHLDSILNWVKEEGLIFQNGSGAGLNLSQLRGSGEKLARGGHSSGPVTFMRAADSSAGTITSGGRTRRAAKMVILNIDHPNIQDFIWCKADEEKKARALAEAGFDMSLNTEEGAKNWASLQYQNANNSVRVTDEFLQAVTEDKQWDLIERTTGEVAKTIRARDLMHEVAEAAWQSADPGIQYDTTINDWHTTPSLGPINASNPCSEYMSNDDTSCNLASLNLMKFRKEDGSFDIESFQHTTRVVFLAQDILIAFADYPTEKIGERTKMLRQIGIGYTNLGALLMAGGLPYDSQEGRNLAAAVTSLLTAESYQQSGRIAALLEPFATWEEDKTSMIRVLEKHKEAAKALDADGVAASIAQASVRSWNGALRKAKADGIRNAQASVLAPTGTISFFMDADTTGIEPDFSLVKFKKLVGGGEMTIVNRTVPMGLRSLGYGDDQIRDIIQHVNETGNITGAPHIEDEHLAVFACAVGENSIHYMGHLQMMAACQPFLSGAISKTVNMPAEATVEDIYETYLEGWRLGLKAVAIYRDGTKVAQPLGNKKSGGAVDSPPPMLWGERRRLPDEPQCLSHRFRIQGYTGYFHIDLFEDGTPGAVFVNIAKAGSQLRGWMDVFSVAASMCLQYGMSVEELIEKFAYTSFEPHGFTRHSQIRSVKSIVDYLAKYLAIQFLDTAAQKSLGIHVNEDEETVEDSTVTVAPSQMPAPNLPPMKRSFELEGAIRRPFKLQEVQEGSCEICGGRLVKSGSCLTCSECGTTTGCG